MQDDDADRGAGQSSDQGFPQTGQRSLVRLGLKALLDRHPGFHRVLLIRSPQSVVTGADLVIGFFG